MKKFKKVSGLFLLSLATLAFAFASCDKDDDNPSALKFNQAKAEMGIAKIDTVKVSGGIVPYTAISSDQTIATVRVRTDTVFITGVKKGNSIVTVKDKNNISGKLPVTVK